MQRIPLSSSGHSRERKISLTVDGRIRANAYSVTWAMLEITERVIVAVLLRVGFGSIGRIGEKLRQRRPIGEVFAREVWSEEAGIAA